MNALMFGENRFGLIESKLVTAFEEIADQSTMVVELSTHIKDLFVRDRTQTIQIKDLATHVRDLSAIVHQYRDRIETIETEIAATKSEIASISRILKIAGIVLNLIALVGLGTLITVNPTTIVIVFSCVAIGSAAAAIVYLANKVYGSIDR